MLYIYLFILFFRPFFSRRIFPVVDDLLTFATILLFLIILFQSIKKRDSSFLFPFPAFFSLSLLAMLFGFFLSLVFSSSPMLSLRAIEGILSGIGLLALTAHFVGQSDAPLRPGVTAKNPAFLILLLLIFQGTILSVYGLRQYLFSFPYAIEYIQQSSMSQEIRDYSILLLSKQRIFSLFFSPNLFAVYLICLLPLAYCLIAPEIPHKKKMIDSWKSVLGLLSLLLFLLCLFLTRSIGAIASLVIGFLLFLVIFYGSMRKRIKVLSLLALGIVFVFGALIVWSRFDYFFNLLHPENSVVQRLFYWQTTLKVIKNNWLWGVGPGNFRFFYTHYMNPLATETRFAHNLFLQIFAETGVVGFTGFLLFINATGVIIVKTFLRRGSSNGLLLQKCCAMGVGFFLIHNMFSYSFFQSESEFLLWVFLGIIVGCPAPQSSQHAPLKAKASLTAIAIGASLVFGDVSIRAIADYCFWTEKTDISSSLRQKKYAIAINPFELPYYLELASSLKEHNPEKAITLYQKAIGIAPAYYHPYLELSKLLYTVGRPGEATPYLLRARLLHPSHPEIKSLFSQN